MIAASRRTIAARRTALIAVAAVFLLLLGYLVGIFILSVLDREPFGFWQSLAVSFRQSEDLDPVDFATLVRRGNRTDGLACPAELSKAATVDFDPSVFTISADRLTTKLRSIALGEPRTRELEQPAPDRLRFVQASLLLRLPDVIDVRIVARGSGTATLALYSRGAFGLADFGDNRERVARWLDLLGQ